MPNGRKERFSDLLAVIICQFREFRHRTRYQIDNTIVKPTARIIVAELARVSVGSLLFTDIAESLGGFRYRVTVAELARVSVGSVPRTPFTDIAESLGGFRYRVTVAELARVSVGSVLFADFAESLGGFRYGMIVAA